MLIQGDIYQLGQHRLMCGDATNKSDVEKLIDSCKVNLVLTDPPYGINIQFEDGRIGGGLHNLDSSCWHKGKAIHCKQYPMLIGNDDQNAAREHYKIVKDICKTQIFWGGQYFAHFLPISGGWIFWDKKTGGYFSDGELAWCSKGQRVRRYEHQWSGFCRAGTHALNGKTRVHPTQKPVELCMKILEDFSNEGNTVLDCFGGSGTTLIACEQVNRKCLMMELSPEYCEIIINRWEELAPALNKRRKIL